MKNHVEMHGEYSDVPHPVAQDVSGFLLTGGKSERMGQDKALLPHPKGGTLLEHGIATLSAVASRVAIVGPRERYARYAWAGEIIEDKYEGRGPLAGIHAAVASSQSEWNLVLAVDCPAITPEFLRWLLEQARAAQARVTVPRMGGGLHPLCAVYRRDFAEIAQRTLDGGRNKIDVTFEPATTRILDEDELRLAGFGPELFININTPEEMRSAGEAM